MAAVHRDAFEEGMIWLPSNVIDEACDTKEYYTRHCQQNLVQLHRQQQQKLLRNKFKTASPEAQPQHPRRPRTRSYSEKPRIGNGGPGMQAIFLESEQRPCGTGVFLPQPAGTNFRPSKKPVCAPVLLPARVVQALNLNMHELAGLQISPRQDPKHNPRRGYEKHNNSVKNKNGNKGHASKQCGVTCQNQSSSPEIFLPKEWTY
ncbi:hypothetical protein L6164_010105 [Bauhinia variegata]|uniref:Uncharacterized protein n=1 Tax=Bauhinia variegata TaxID=167791 RepID=A0ACB9PL76_BAUVA|nr:hypothetical protein L6164_010105 [Bauhinia variegata]